MAAATFCAAKDEFQMAAPAACYNTASSFTINETLSRRYDCGSYHCVVNPVRLSSLAAPSNVGNT